MVEGGMCTASVLDGLSKELEGPPAAGELIGGAGVVVGGAAAAEEVVAVVLDELVLAVVLAVRGTLEPGTLDGAMTSLVAMAGGTDTLGDDIIPLVVTSDDTSPPPLLAVWSVPCPPSEGRSWELFLNVTPKDTLTASPTTNTAAKHSTVANRMCRLLQRLRGVTEPIM